MPQPMGFQIRLGWSGWLALLLALGIALTLAAVATVLFIILLPVMVLSAVLYYLFPSFRYGQPRRARERDIIEGEYRIVDPTRAELDPPPTDRP